MTRVRISLISYFILMFLSFQMGFSLASAAIDNYIYMYVSNVQLCNRFDEQKEINQVEGGDKFRQIAT